MMESPNKVYQIGYGVDIPLKSKFMNTLHGTTHGNIVSVSPYRPKSVQTIYQYRDNPINPCDVGRGNHSKASVLLQMARRRTSPTCSDSWKPNTERLCKIRYYYQLADTRPKTTLNTRSLSSASYKSQQRRSQSQQTTTNQYKKPQQVDDTTPLEDTFTHLSINGSRLKTTTNNREFTDKQVNTERSFYSLAEWHGANWQKSLPQMYLPRCEKYDAYNSLPVRLKSRPSRFRDAGELIRN